FISRPVRWRGLTMDAAKWTLTNAQLQDVVGSAIRRTAETSSIRILMPQAFNTEIPEEIQRLERCKTDITDKYRSIVDRRQLQFQKLLLFDGNESLTAVVEDLTEILITSDRLFEKLFRVMDELCQLHQLCDVHLSSTLSMALRKLNSKFLMQSVDMKDMSRHITQVEAERDEAWKIAERVEKELIKLQ
ncbi:hypothetical protein BU17DRAFT_22795, partial [Hysterangium stoloniferum]